MENHVGVGYCFYTCRNNSSLPSSDAISTMTPTSHQVIQVRDLGTTFKQANSCRKRPHLNPYIPQSSAPSVHTSLTFSSCHGGTVKASRHYITKSTSLSGVTSGVPLQSEAPYEDFNDNFVRNDMDFGYMDDDSPVPSKRRRTAAVGFC